MMGNTSICNFPGENRALPLVSYKNLVKVRAPQKCATLAHNMIGIVIGCSIQNNTGFKEESSCAEKQ